MRTAEGGGEGERVIHSRIADLRLVGVVLVYGVDVEAAAGSAVVAGGEDGLDRRLGRPVLARCGVWDGEGVRSKDKSSSKLMPSTKLSISI